METNDHIDARLAVAATRGDDAALRRLFERYIGPVHSFVRRFVGSSDDAEDITQQSFVNVWKHLDRYDPSRPFSTWLFTIAHNEAVNWLRRKRPDALTPEMEDTIADPAARPDELALQAASARFIGNGMAQLDEPARRVVSLRHDDGMTFREMADVLGEPLNTVKSRYRRALDSLRKLLR